MGKGRSRRRKQRKRRSKQDAVALPPLQSPPVMASLDAGDDTLAIPLAVADDVLVQDQPSQAAKVPQNRQARRKAKSKKAKVAKRTAKAEVIEPVLETAEAEQFFEGKPPLELVVGEASPNAPISSAKLEATPPEAGEKPAIPLDDTISGSKEEYLITDEAVAEPKLLSAPVRQPDAPLVDTEALSELLSSCPASSDPTLDEVFKPTEQERRPAMAAEIANRPIEPIPRHNALADPNAKVLTRLRLWMMRFFEPKAPTRSDAHANLPIDQLVELQSDLSRIQRQVDRMIAANRS